MSKRRKFSAEFKRVAVEQARMPVAHKWARTRDPDNLLTH